ncbi:hypothetical protein WME91_33065 [Sorangium sp. So ce269]
MLFVEGQDMKLLRALAAKAGAQRVAGEEGLAMIQLNGFSHWQQVEPFGWLIDNLLEKSVGLYVILDRDYRFPEITKSIMEKLSARGVAGHVWRRKELESYLLEPGAISRLSKATPMWVEAALREIADGLRTHVFARAHDEHWRHERELARGSSLVSATEEFERRFSEVWTEVAGRIHLCPAKDVLTELNKKLVAGGHRSVSFRALAKEMRPEEIPHEMVSVLRTVDQLLAR